MDKNCKYEMCKTCVWSMTVHGNIWNGYCRVFNFGYVKNIGVDYEKESYEKIYS